MTDPLRSNRPATPADLQERDRDARVEHLLLAGLDHYFAGQYELAISVWTRVLFLNHGHARARAYMRELSLLHSEITARLAGEGHAVEAKPYTPHLTIARVKEARGPSARAARDIARKARGRGGSARVEEVTLFQSHQSAAGSVYDRLLRIPLLK